VNIGEINGISATQANAIANQAVEAFITGAKPTLFDLYQSSQNKLERLGQTPSQLNASDLRRSDLKVTFEQQMTLNQHFEPSKLFLTLGLSGAGQPQHKWDKKAIDSPIGPT
jgi:hypothetical protein